MVIFDTDEVRNIDIRWNKHDDKIIYLSLLFFNNKIKPHFGGHDRLRASHEKSLPYLREPFNDRPYSIHAYLPSRSAMVLTSVSQAHEYWGEMNLSKHENKVNEKDEEEERKHNNWEFIYELNMCSVYVCIYSWC